MCADHVTPTAPSHAGTSGRVAPTDTVGIYAWVRERGVRGNYPVRMVTAAAVRAVNGTEPPTVAWLAKATEIPPPHFQRVFDSLVRAGVFRLHGTTVEVRW